MSPTISKITAAKSIKAKKMDLQNQSLGEKDTAIVIARKLRTMGLTDEEIINATSLSAEQMKKL